ncbi:8-oxo-dGTP diphosphatase [Candidatus Peregrinibacteria bacterium]|nr:8-oxo-dGTP diphosphatase [Candidatus Peregrinibacteria bacterium]
MDPISTKKPLTLCLAVDSNRVLLGMKKRGFGAGRWNGFGGKLAPGENIEQAARREMLEEAGVTIGAMERVARMEFEWQGNPVIHEVHLFRVDTFDGTPVETEEMRPQWFTHDQIPFDTMWPDDPLWFPLFLAGKNFIAKILFGPEDRILSCELTETDTF